MRKILIFDVNETLLDLAALDSEFEKIFGSAEVRKEWFGQFIQSAFVTIITDTYHPFGQVGSAAFDMIAEKHGITVAESDKMALLGKIAQLPPHPEVASALEKLKGHGFQMATLTNSTYEVAEKQLQNAELSQYFDKILSVDAIKKLKPAKETYEMAAKAFDVQTNDVCLIAAHAWDISGALNAGCSAAFVARDGMVLDPLSPVPTITARSLKEIADLLISEAND
jgi:2-haloacid dehalogenase